MINNNFSEFQLLSDLNLSEEIKSIIDEIKSVCQLNLASGPVIAGGAVTYCAESYFRRPNWFPNDIDITCCTLEQFERTHEILKKISLSFEAGPSIKPLIKPYDFLNHTMNGYTIQLINSPGLVVKSWSQRVDYTICGGYTNGIYAMIPFNTQFDIQNKVLKEVSNNTTKQRIERYGFEEIKNRYQKYINRGYVDHEQIIFNKLKLYESQVNVNNK